jgi:hypothetical protein
MVQPAAVHALTVRIRIWHGIFHAYNGKWRGLSALSAVISRIFFAAAANGNNVRSFRARSRMRAAQASPRAGGMADDKLCSDCGVTAHLTGVLRTQA